MAVTAKLSDKCVKHVIDEMMKDKLRQKVVTSFGRDPYQSFREDAEKAINAMSNLELLDLIEQVQSEQ
ncbi:hypothetical protein ACU8MG_22785 [Rhizobium leguminosarum]